MTDDSRWQSMLPCRLRGLVLVLLALCPLVTGCRSQIASKFEKIPIGQTLPGEDWQEFSGERGPLGVSIEWSPGEAAKAVYYVDGAEGEDAGGTKVVRRQREILITDLKDLYVGSDPPKARLPKYYYLVATSIEDKVVGKAILNRRKGLRRTLIMDGRDLRDFVRIQKQFPYHGHELPSTVPKIAAASREGGGDWFEVIPSGGARWRRWDYPALARPLSADDRILPSGVRESTWAALSFALAGWPFAKANRQPTVWIDGEQVYWVMFEAFAEQGLVFGHVVIGE